MRFTQRVDLRGTRPALPLGEDQPLLYMKRTYQPLPASDEPMGIVINRGPRDQVADLPSDHPRVWAYVWAPAPDEIDLALMR